MREGKIDKVIYFTGCFANYYNPEIGKAFVEVMERNGLGVIVPEQICCGMPIMANANYEKAKKNFERIIKDLYGFSKSGYPILTTCPSCNMMLKKEGKAFFPMDEIDYVSRNLYDFSEFLILLDSRGGFNRDFGTLHLKIIYHNPCHLKVQNIDSTIRLLSFIPGLEVLSVNRDCCGLGGSFGLKSKNYRISRRIGDKIWKMIDDLKPDAVVTECGGCGLQISSKQGIRIYHPAELIRMAYHSAKKDGSK